MKAGLAQESYDCRGAPPLTPVLVWQLMLCVVELKA